MSEIRVIKRYANRKLYDTLSSKYVTLDQISEMIRRGEDVKIVDNTSMEDLTSVTLAQIIFEEEKKHSFLSLQAMRDIIQNGGESLTQLVSEAQRRVTSILPRRKEEPEPEADEDAAASDRAEAPADEQGIEAHEPARRGREGLASLREFREWVQQSQRTIDEWQKRVDHRIRDMVEGISPFSGLQKDVQVLATRIAELEDKLAQLAAGDEAAPAVEARQPGADATEPAE